ncbi:transducin family protein/WD-40 repeat family protein [Lactarius akahatsu]|uniref:Transducin family protein/WD-40 repeat family protein n=1 Tax=Lactarius akahatsu TaxID=416441 RepID=A0AAD4QD33_9AGAM|nr:transducin family protein/WD-40 repeat family protein [Lactarius akahatsu]
MGDLIVWVKRGTSAPHSSKQPLNDADIERVKDIANIQLEDARTELELHDIKVDYDDEDSAWVDEGDEAMDDDATKDFVSPKRNGDLSEYNLDTYDEDDRPASTFGPFASIKGLQFHRDNDDPYITHKEDDDELEREENEVLPTDNMLVTAIVEQNVPQLHFFVYDEPTEYLGPHHDLLLSNMPLCLECLDYPVSSATKEESMDTEDGPGSRFGNYVAIGTLEPEIEIYSIELLDSKKRKKAKHRSASEAHYVDAILSLSWNRTARQMLASGGADRTVKLWDLSRDPKEGALRSFGKLHKDKVQAVQWNPTDPAVLVSGSYDRTVRVFDSRAPDASNGMVVNFDARTLPSDLDPPSPTRFTIAAHDGAACALDVNAHIRGCLTTAGTDNLVKIWNVQEHEDGTKRQISLIAGHDLGLIWDVGANFGARKVFGPRLAEAGRKLRERTTGGVISVADDEEDSDDEEE